MEPMTPSQRDTSAWIFQSWASFILASGATAVGIGYLPVDIWIKAFLAMGMLFTIGSAFTLAKTVRDNAEARRVSSVVQSAKVEEILSKRPVSI